MDLDAHGLLGLLHRDSLHRLLALAVDNSLIGLWEFRVEPPIDPGWSLERQMQHVLECAVLSWCNKTMAAMYCAGIEDLVNNPLKALLEDNPNNMEILTEGLKKGQVDNVLSYEKTPVGRKVFRNSLVVGHDGRGWINSAIGMQVDVTEEHLLREKAERLNREKSELVRTLAHEIKTPLGTIVSAAEIVRHGVEDPDPRGHLKLIINSALMASAVVQDFLDQCLMETGNITVKPHAYPIGTAVQHALEMLDSQMKKKNIGLIRNSRAIPDAWVDPIHCKQIFLNLLNNAVKFTPVGGKIEVELHDQDDVVVVSIRDTGCGIAPDDLPSVFLRDRRGKSAHLVEGWGIGLDIVQQRVRLNGGTITAESPGEGMGSTFTVSFPKHKPVV